MEEGIKDEGPNKAVAATTEATAGEANKQSTATSAAAAAAGSSSSSPPPMADVTFKGIGDVLKLLPTASVIVYEVLNPIVTNTGKCGAGVGYKIATGVLLGVSAFFCAFSTFTDSYVGADGKVKYGLVTPRGLLPFSDDGGAAAGGGRPDLSRYRLRFADFVHAAFAVAVFAAVSLLADANTVACFYPSLGDKQKEVVMAIPVVVGAVASVVFVVFPSTRHGIGYPPSKPETTALASQ